MNQSEKNIIDLKQKMAELNTRLLEASRAYYQESREIMSNYEYDELYDELLRMEKESGIVLANSVTANVGYQVVSELPKVQHPAPMLSLDKTKSVDALKEWLGDKEGVLSWKLDGLTVALTYEKGELISAVTRGNGYVGEEITNNAKQFDNIPLKIPYDGTLVLRGEAVIKYSDFAGFAGEYKNPRNLCSGSVRQLDSQITAKRHVNCVIFSLVNRTDTNGSSPSGQTMSGNFEWLNSLGFETVPFRKVTADSLGDAVEKYAEEINTFDIPSDGLVLSYDDIDYGKSLGMTAKFPRSAIAFKWRDETEETILKYIEWSPSRTGLINPVAVFEPVEIEGSTVSRASVHNVSVMKELKLGEGDRITVYKANMIIPQIAENLTRSATCIIPDKCPVCGAPTEIHQDNDAQTLFCINPECPAKQIKSYALLASRDAMNIDGMSEATLEKLIGAGFIKTYADIFNLSAYRNEIAAMEGFGEKSADNLINAAAKAADTTLPRFIYSLGIPGIGSANAKQLAKNFTLDELRKAEIEELTETEGVGAVLADGIVKFFSDEAKQKEIDELLKKVTIETVQEDAPQNMEGLTFVITGSLENFTNRKELEDIISHRGGKVSSSVSAKTDYLINNDVTSNSSKNKKARELGIPIISEGGLLEKFDIGI